MIYFSPTNLKEDLYYHHIFLRIIYYFCFSLSESTAVVNCNFVAAVNIIPLLTRPIPLMTFDRNVDRSSNSTLNDLNRRSLRHFFLYYFVLIGSSIAAASPPELFRASSIACTGSLVYPGEQRTKYTNKREHPRSLRR